MIANIIEELRKRLQITEDQAKGGLGILLKFCQDKLAAQDFTKLTETLGNNWQELLKAAPQASSNLMGKLGGFASHFGGKAAQLGQYANFASAFKTLGIDVTKINKFVDVVLQHVSEKGGPQAKEMISKFWKKS